MDVSVSSPRKALRNYCRSSFCLRAWREKAGYVAIWNDFTKKRRFPFQVGRLCRSAGCQLCPSMLVFAKTRRGLPLKPLLESHWRRRARGVGCEKIAAASWSLPSFWKDHVQNHLYLRFSWDVERKDDGIHPSAGTQRRAPRRLPRRPRWILSQLNQPGCWWQRLPLAWEWIKPMFVLSSMRHHQNLSVLTTKRLGLRHGTVGQGGDLIVLDLRQSVRLPTWNVAEGSARSAHWITSCICLFFIETPDAHGLMGTTFLLTGRDVSETPGEWTSRKRWRSSIVRDVLHS